MALGWSCTFGGFKAHSKFPLHMECNNFAKHMEMVMQNGQRALNVLDKKTKALSGICAPC